MTPRPTILIVTALFPPDPTSYAGTFIVEQLKALQEWYEVVVITPFFPKLKEFFFIPAVRHQKINGCQVYYVKHLAHGSLFRRIWQRLVQPLPHEQLVYETKKDFAARFTRLARGLHRRYHFLLVHGHETYIGDEAVPIAKELGIPSIVTLHGIFHYHQKSWGDQVMSRILSNLNQASRLISVSHVSADSYKAHLSPAKPITIIPNGLRPQNSQPLPESWKVTIGQRQMILCIGTLVAEKRFDQVIKAAHAVQTQLGNSFVICVLGQGPEQIQLEKLAKQLGLANQFYVVGPVPPDKMAGWYSAATVLAHPSVIESFSMVALEAMSFGKPVIMTNAIGLAEYINQQQDAIVILPDNTDELTEALYRVLKDKELSAQLGKSARQRSEQFNWNIIAPKIKSVYESFSK